MSVYQVSYERVFNLGNYESERISAVALVENDDIEAAFAEAKSVVESARTIKPPPSNGAGASYEAPATDNQRNYIATLQDKLQWNSEQMAAYAEQKSIDLVSMTKAQASPFIDGLKRLAEQTATEGGIVRWAERVVTPGNVKEQTEDLPF